MNDWRSNLDVSPSDISHFGILGMHWGVRRYQNTDGSYTSQGMARYGVGDGRGYRNLNNGGTSSGSTRKGLSKGQKRAIAIGVAAVGAGVAAVAIAKMHKSGSAARIASKGAQAVKKITGSNQLRLEMKDTAKKAKPKGTKKFLKGAKDSLKKYSPMKKDLNKQKRDLKSKTVKDLAKTVKKDGKRYNDISKKYMNKVRTAVNNRKNKAMKADISSNTSNAKRLLIEAKNTASSSKSSPVKNELSVVKSVAKKATSNSTNTTKETTKTVKNLASRGSKFVSKMKNTWKKFSFRKSKKTARTFEEGAAAVDSFTDDILNANMDKLHKAGF